MFNSESSSPDTAYPGVEHDGNKTLVDLLYNGFYLLFALRNGQLPQDAAAFWNEVDAEIAAHRARLFHFN